MTINQQNTITILTYQYTTRKILNSITILTTIRLYIPPLNTLIITASRQYIDIPPCLLSLS
nr:MAG TPA: hypothetical protein [Caudoviricetes sp.]